MKPLKQHIWLCGFMGCGKSTVGARLSSRCGVPLIDMDQYIEEDEGRTIPAIFAESGEAYFRQLEAEAIRSLGTHTPSIIATGGGAMISPENAEEAKKSGIVVLLDLPFAVCYGRIATSDRPIVKRSTKEELHALYDTRRKVYLAHADIALSGIESSDQAVQDLIEIIAKKS